MRRHASLIIAVMVATSLMLSASPAWAQMPLVFSTVLPVRPLGVFGNYVIGFSERGAIAAVDVSTLRITELASATALGVDPASAAFLETAGHFAVYDSDDIVVFDSSLRLVGRASLEVPARFALLPSGRVVAWKGSMVVALDPPRYTVSVMVDLWEHLYRLLVAGDLNATEWLVKAYGINIEATVDEMRRELEGAAANVGANVTEFTWRVYHDVEAHAVSEARSKLSVSVEAAMVFANGSLAAATNVLFKTVIEARVVAEGEGGRIYEFVTRREFAQPRGLLITLGAGGSARIADYYEYVESAGAGAAVAYVYRPFTWKTLSPRVMVVMREHGEVAENPVYFYSPVVEVVVAPADGNVIFVRTAAGVAYVFVGRFMSWSFRAQRIVDADVHGGNVYFAYVNAEGVFEIGVADTSGRVQRLAVEVEVPVAGVHVTGALAYVACVTPTGLLNLRAYSVASPVATVRILVVDEHGVPVPVEAGRVVVIHGNYVLVKNLTSSTEEVGVPVPSTLVVEAFVPFGYARESFNFTSPGTYEVRVRARYSVGQPPLEPPPKVSGLEGFYADILLISDADIAKVSLPGARLLDAWGPFLVLVESSPDESKSVIRVYGVDGSELYSRVVPGYADVLRIFYPYFAVRTGEALYVFDLLTGSVRASVRMFAEGFDFDAANDYLSAWSPARVAVVDLRTGVVSFFEPKAGAISVAPVVRGTVYVHVAVDNATVVYQYNPVTGGVTVTVVSERVVGFASDGYTKIVSFETYSVVFAPRYGILTVPLSGVESVVTLDDERAVPPHLGGAVALAVFSSLGRKGIYTVSHYPEVIATTSQHSRLAVNRRFFVEIPAWADNPRVLMISDFLGVPRVVLVTTIHPLRVAAGEDILAYSDGITTFLIPTPRFIGRYSVTVRTFDAETGRPVDADVRIAELNVVLRTVGGAYSFYLTKPGAAELEVSAPHYEASRVRIEVTGVYAHIVIPVSLTPKKYTLRVLATTLRGEYVREGNVTVLRDGVPIATVGVGERVTVRAGVYTLVFSSPVHATVVQDVVVEENTTVTLVTTQTHSRVRFLVLDETGRPVPNATVVVEYLAERVELVTDATGRTGTAVLPIGVEVKYTVVASGMRPHTGSLVVDEQRDGRDIQVALNRITGSVTISVRDEEGNIESATVVVKTLDGVTLYTLTVEGMSIVDLPIGEYLLEAITRDGRRSTSYVSVAEDNLYPYAEIVLPKKEVPLIARIFPYVVVAVVALVGAVIAYKLLGARRRGPKAKKVGMREE